MGITGRGTVCGAIRIKYKGGLWRPHLQIIATEFEPDGITRLLYVVDKRNKCNYLIDTGAAVSILPRSYLTGPWTLIVYLWSQQITRLSQHMVQVNV